MTNKLTNLANEISNIVENKPYSIVVLESLIDEHKKEKAELSKLANEELKEQNTGMSHTISDLHNSIDALQNEKASLLSIIRLLQSESTVNTNANHSHSAYQKVSYGLW